jgi:hypothetical protein
MTAKNRPVLAIRNWKHMAFVMAFFFIAATAWAQTDTGTITGTITDPTGAVVAGAAVTVTSEVNGKQRQAKSDAKGNYTFSELPSGAYTVAISAQGFAITKETHVVLDAASSRDLNNQLTVGQTSQEIVVTDVAQSQVNTADAQIASTITGKQIDDISLNGRNYVQLMRLLPGVVSTTLDPFTIQLSSMSSYVNGVRGATTLNMVDGLILEDIGANISVFAVPNADSIAEVRVLAASFGADNPSPYGGPTINVITKSGSSDFHGNAFEFVRNQMFNAKPDFSSLVLPLHFNDYGFTLGGPIFFPGHFNADRKKLFFFVSEEWKIIHASTNSTILIPTPAQISGIFTTPVYQPGTKTLYPAGSCTQNPAVLNNAATGYCIPQSAFSTIGAKMLSLFPTPNVVGNSAYNYASPLLSNLDNREDRYNVDYLPTQRDVLTFHFAKELNNQSTGNAGNIIPLTVTPRPAYIFSVNETHTFTPNIINTLVVGETHNLYAQTPNTKNVSLANLGLTLNNPFPVNNFGIVPNLSITGYTGYSTVAGDTKTVENLLLTDDLSWVKGRHTMKFGAYLQHSKDDEHSFSVTQGAVTYNSGAGVPNTTGNSIGDALVGNFSAFTQNSTPGFFLPRYLDQEFYAMDTWRAAARLTIEGGLRYSYSQLPYSAMNNQSIFTPSLYSATQAPTVSATTGALTGNYNPYNGLQIVGNGFPSGASKFFGNVEAISNTSPLTYAPILTDPLVLNLFSNLPRTYNKTPKDNFAPRMGFAYDVFGNGKTAIRGSYGIFFMRENTFSYETDTSNLPFNSALSISNGNIANPGGVAGTVNPVSLYTFAGGFKAAYLQTRSLGFQQQLPKQMIVEVNYVGNEALHMPMLINLNQLQPGTTLNALGAGGTSTGSTANINSLRPYKGFGAISQQIYADTSNYNSLQATLGRRVGTGWNYSASYTFSKTMEGTSQNLAATSLPENSFNYKADYSIADIDRAQVLTANSTYDLPFFLRSKHLALKEGLGGWVVSGVFLIQTGAPLNVLLNKDYAGIGSDGTAERPTVAPGVSPYTHQNCSGMAKFSCNYLVNANNVNVGANGVVNPGGVFATPLPGTFGNASRNYVFGPKYTSTDVSVFKHLKFGERYDAQFRAESFNVFNRGSLTTIGTTLGNAGFGVVSNAAPGRVLQFGAKVAF